LLVADNVYISYGELRRNSETVGRENTDESVVDTAKWGNMRIATKWWVEVMKVVGEGVGQSTALVGLQYWCYAQLRCHVIYLLARDVHYFRRGYSV
jgi:hypothetical protein